MLKNLKSQDRPSVHENGRYNPSILLAFKIANLFGVSIEEIFIYEGENDNDDEK